MALSAQWNIVCDGYLRAFCKQIGLDYEDAYWPRGEVGTTIVFPDGEAFSMDEIRYVVDCEVSYETLMAWYYYTLDIHEINVESQGLQGYQELHSINLESWCNGAPKPYTAEQLRRMKDSLAGVRKARESFLATIKGCSEDIPF